MKTKLVFSTKKNDFEQWTDMPFIPRIGEWINLVDILKEDEKEKILKATCCWSGIRGTIQSVEYRHDDNEFYVEVYVWCED